VTAALLYRRIDWPQVWRAIIVIVLTAPVPLYSFLVFKLDPILAVWFEQSVLLSPPPPHYIAAYLLLGILAIISLLRFPHSEVRSPNLIGWLIIIPILIYVPVSFQRRLFEGWQVPLCIFAAIGLVFGGWWFISARKWFKGPVRMGTDEELERLEEEQLGQFELPTEAR
jgi:hypothetical protein